ncbi:MAG: HAD-IC family P-type ATPase, partial [Patescibacteria group bacterium]
MFRTVVALSVSAIPEGLPVVLTIVLATGVFRMSRRNALVKRLQAVEALGQATVIAVDKTGTITKNEMVVRNVFVNGRIFDIGGSGYEPRGEISSGKEVIDPLNHEELIFAGRLAALCANARVSFVEEGGYWRVAGDPTEAAMLVFAEKIGFKKFELEKEASLIAEMPFDYKNKYHATSHRVDHKELVVISGAPEKILDLSNREYSLKKESVLPNQTEFLKITKERRDYLESIFLELSRKGKRVVAFAFAELPLKPREEYTNAMIDLERVNEIIFGGFYGMEDSIRPEAVESIKAAESAGVRVVMITGDHRVTAEAIAREIGIFKDHDGVLTDEEVDRLSIPDLAKALGRARIFARITPDHKMKIIKAFKYRGDIVAMTGDGVNDAPSLVAADLGVSMGKIGTEVAKEASDIVILDDNLGTIVAAIEEGRSILKTIKKVI